MQLLALLVAVTLSFTLANSGSSTNLTQGNCPALNMLIDQASDAGSTLQKCLDQTPAGGTLTVAPGSYQLATPIRISNPLTIQTAGSVAGSHCWQADDRGCARLIINMQAKDSEPAWQRQMPMEISGNNVTFHHLVISGMRGHDPANDKALCLAPKLRSMGGGLRIAGDHFALQSSALVNFACYTAMEVTTRGAVLIEDSFVGFNGNHVVHGMWSDGVTIHDAVGAIVRNNMFVDNTDVQLIFGGCRDCLVNHNSLRHSVNPSGGAFAELMLHAWPHVTGGRYDGATISDNNIDCGPRKLCGFGLMIGGAPWHTESTAGGTITRNTIRNAMLGLNVDNLSGPMTITDNQVLNSGGRFEGSCGTRNLPAVNIAPPSQSFTNFAAMARSTDGLPSGEEFAGCIFNHQGPPQDKAR